MFKRIKYIFRLEWKYARIAFMWDVICEAITAVSAVAVPFIMKLLVDAAMTHDISKFRDIIFWAAVIFAVNIAQSIIYMTTVYYRQDYILTKDIKLKNDLYSKTLKISPECFEKPDTYDIYNRVTEISLDDIHGAFNSLLNSLFKIITIVSVAVIMIGYSPIIALIYLITYIPLFWLKLVFEKKLNKFKVDNTVENRKKEVIFDFIHDKKAVAELKIFGAVPFIIRRRNEIAKRLNNDYIYMQAKNQSKQEAVGSIPDIVYYISYVVYAVLAVAGTISYGDLTFLITAMGTYSNTIFEMSVWLTNQQDNFYMMDKMIAFFELPQERTDCAPKTDAFSSLELNDVSFTYPGSEQAVLKHINLSIKRGEKVAIVGYNGSGKTTTVKLLLGLFDSYKGKYSINGFDTKQMNHRDIYHMFSVGMQDYQKYPFSVRENIEISDYHKNDSAMLQKAAELSGVDELVKTLSKGYDTNLNKQYDADGTDLSEGQWHKLILARALYQSHDVVVFDEPTSSLDPISEYEFVQAMKRCMDEKTVIMITHRLSSVVDFERIVVFKDGEIIGDGKHSELMKGCPTYREMFETQASRYDVAAEPA